MSFIRKMMKMKSPQSDTSPHDPAKPPVKLLAFLEQDASFLLLGHRNPDGDALGSALALGLLLRSMGKTVSIAFPSAPPPWAHILPGVEMLVHPPVPQADAAIALDCDGADRLAELKPVFLAHTRCADIDHHTGNDRPCVLSWVDSSASATGILIYRIVRALNQPLTPEIATCIYTAIATDTGFFRFANTDAETLRTCAECVAAGADPRWIAKHVIEDRPLAHILLKGRALAGLEQWVDGHVLCATLSQEDFDAANATRAHVEGIIDEVKRAQGFVAYVLFKGTAQLDQWDVSLRSETIDCAAAAAHFGGGGHRAAAGFSYSGNLAKVREELLSVLARAIAEVGND